jgi:hypothetical protein
MSQRHRLYRNFMGAFGPLKNKVVAVVNTHEREESLSRCLESLSDSMGTELVAVCIYDTSPEPTPRPNHQKDFLVVEKNGKVYTPPIFYKHAPQDFKKPLGTLRNEALRLYTTQMPTEDFAVLILDDDIELNPAFGNQIQPILMWLSEPFTGVVQIAHKQPDPHQVAELRTICTTGGGILFRWSAYLLADMFGEDYFDVPELCLRMSEAYDAKHLFWPYVVNKHHYDEKGGLKSIYPEKKNCNEMRHLSNLVDMYPYILEKDENAWLGFSLRDR